MQQEPNAEIPIKLCHLEIGIADQEVIQGILNCYNTYSATTLQTFGIL